MAHLRPLFVAVVVALLMSPSRAGEPVLRETFDGPDALAAWEPLGTGGAATVSPDGSLVVTRAGHAAAGGAGGEFVLRRRVDAGALRDHFVYLSARVSATDVSAPAEAWNGVKVMLHTRGPGGPAWHNPADLAGTFPARVAGASAAVPGDADEAWVVLGLQDATGTATFDDVTLTAGPKRRARPAEPRGWAPAPVVHRGVMSGHGMTRDDVRRLAQDWRVNLIRWQLFMPPGPDGRWDGWRDMPAYDRWLDAAVREFDAARPWCAEFGVRVALDLHTPPGGGIFVGDWPLFTDRRYQDRFLAIWRELAARYNGDTTVWAFDIANEPIEGAVAPDCAGWRELAWRATQAIRAIDPGRTVIVPFGNGGGWDRIDYFEPLPVGNVVYTVHLYDPGPFTHQGVLPAYPVGPTYPGTVGDKHWDRAAIRAALQPVVDYQHDYGVPVYVGEFSAVRWAPGAARYLADATSIFEELGWDWTYHAYKEWHGWSLDHTDDKDDPAPATQPTDRMRVMMRAFAGPGVRD